MKHHFVFNKPAIHFILLVGIFTFVFLGAEYLFVNMISLSVTEGKTVIAQNYALGASAVGFFPYPAMDRWVGSRYTLALHFILALCAISLPFFFYQLISAKFHFNQSIRPISQMNHRITFQSRFIPKVIYFPIQCIRKYP